MADSKISALTAVTAVVGSDEIELNEAGASKKATIDALALFMLTAGKYAPGSFTLATGTYVQMVKTLILTNTQRATLQGTARVRID